MGTFGRFLVRLISFVSVTFLTNRCHRFTNFQSVGFTLSLVMISANVGGYTKRQTMNAVTFIAYCVGNIIGPFTIKQSEAKRSYPTATTVRIRILSHGSIPDNRDLGDDDLLRCQDRHSCASRCVHAVLEQEMGPTRPRER